MDYTNKIFYCVFPDCNEPVTSRCIDGRLLCDRHSRVKSSKRSHDLISKPNPNRTKTLYCSINGCHRAAFDIDDYGLPYCINHWDQLSIIDVVEDD